MDQNKHKTILHNKHLLIETNRGVLLIDTGSPASFHEASCIEINGREHKVSTSYMGLTAQYLSQKIGCQISGLLGMDIISLGDFSISHKDGGTTFSFQIPSTHNIDFVNEKISVQTYKNGK